ncbi:hypothetical protein GOP47_0020812 [Adiantum capillus-veneris]|uniref:Uncharacterized protein n=1 Tax=Adiantum capillus-veneris TaxID=13818 RepID=A0A9D4UA93_ADICA|nr:hypothetical protein GOP47_0020812 [Adiantum capillus-veneris]
MLSDFGGSKRENSGDDPLKECDNTRKRSSEDGDFLVLPSRASSSPSETYLSASKLPIESRGSWKRNRTARKDGGARRWENANTEVLQLPNGRFKTFSPGSLVWGKRDNGLRWPAQVCSLEETVIDKLNKPKSGKHILVKFVGLDDSDGNIPFSYVDPKSLSIYKPNIEKLVKQSFNIPDEKAKFEASIVKANEVYAMNSDEGLICPLAELDGMDMEDTSKQQRKKRSGSGSKQRSKLGATAADGFKDVDAIKPRKRQRESRELKLNRYIDYIEFEEDPQELSADTQSQHRAKKRRLSAVRNGLIKELAAKQDILDHEIAFREKTRGDDGYFFECVVCDMGGNLLCCDYCPRTYHLDCLDPPLKRAPPGKWHCPTCRENLASSKVPLCRSLDSKRSKSKKSTISTSDALLSSSKDKKTDNSEASASAPSLPQKRTKSLRKFDDGRAAIKASLQAQLCSLCGTNIESNSRSLQGACLCKDCDKAGGLDTGGSPEKESKQMGTSDTEVKVIDAVKRIPDDHYKKASMLALEVDRIFGCRLMSSVLPSGHVLKHSSQETEPLLESSTEGKSNSAVEVRSMHALRECENGADRESNSWIVSDQEKPSNNGVPENLKEAAEATSSSCLVSRGTSLQTKNEESMNNETISNSEAHTMVGRENDEISEAQKDLDANDDKPPLLYEFLVKWVGKSHIHDQWVKETELKALAKRKLDNYRFKYRNACINLVNEMWCKPQRIVAKRQELTDAHEVLVKWCGLPYDECTWENIDEPVIENHPELLESYNNFEKAALADEEVVTSQSVDKRSGEISTLIEQPEYIKGGTLFPHQMEALNWLRKCWGRKKNVILADEMGLGKTISASAFLCSLYKEFKVNAPCLVLVPLSTMPNWMAEFSMWTPDLNVVEYHGGAKARAIIRQFEWHATGGHNLKKDQRSFKFNVLLTTYEMIIADASQLRSIPWEVLIVDEGHRLKNTGSKLVQLLNTFSFSQRVLLTGTPLQNNIGEMHNLLRFLQLDAFPSLAAFEDKFSSLSTAEQVDELKKLVAPHMLRRLKKDAMQNIPPKMECVVPVELSSLQAEYYRALLTKNYQVLRQAGKPNQHQSLVNIVVQLRKVCNHPYLIPGTEPETGSADFLQEMRIKASAKLTLLHAMLKVLKEQGHRVLIFSQMTRLLDILEDYLVVEFGNNTFERVDGSISVADRQAAIARFNQDPSRFVFLLSTRACGLGINLATADTVIIYDSDFNPHADIQAMNRAHRIGQSKRLLVYRLVVRASVEERILQLAKRKLMLDHLFANKSGSQKEVEDILKWGTEELFQDGSATGEGVSSVSCADDVVEGSAEPDGKHRKRSGGLGDVYEDTCHKAGRAKILWDDTAIARLLDRSEIGTEALEAEGESDMLGSFKAWDWNEQEAGDDEEANDCLIKEKDADSPFEANAVTSGQGAEEESNWDKILRTRWEKQQIEEEGALGRGKRTRKTVSYKEDFNMAVAEVSSESGNEDEDPEPEYTPAGRALKSKLARLRARQKERIAARGNKDSVENFGVFYNSLAYSCIGSQVALPPCTTSMFLPVQLSEQDLQTLLSNTGVTTSVFMAERNDPAAKGDLATPETEASLQPGRKRDRERGLCEQEDSTCNEIMKTETLANNLSRDSDQAAGGEETGLNAESLHGQTIEAHAGNISLDSQADATGKEGEPNSIALLNIRAEALDVQDLLSREKLESTCGLFLQTLVNRPPLESGSMKSIPEFLSTGPESTPEHRIDVLETSRLMEHPEKSRAVLNLGSTNSSQSSTVADCLAEGCAPKSEPDLGCGSNIAGCSHQSDEIKEKPFPFLPFSGDDRVACRTSETSIWTEEELDTLWSGVRRHGRGNWAVMLRDPKLCFSKLKTVKDLEVRWNEEQIKLLGGPLEYRDPCLNEGTKALLNTFCAGFQTPTSQRDNVYTPGGTKDFTNPAGLMQTRGFTLPDFDMESLSRRGSRVEAMKLPSLPQFGAELKSQLPHLSSTPENTVFSREPVPWMDLGHKFDLPMPGLKPMCPDKQGVYPSKDRGPLFSGARGISPSTTQSSPFQLNQSSADLQVSGLLPRCSVGDNEWKFSNLQLRFEKGPPFVPADLGELPKSRLLSDKLAQSLQDLPGVKPNLNFLLSEKHAEPRGGGLHQKLGSFNMKGVKEKSKASQSAQPNLVAEGAGGKTTNSSSLPHWLREAFKPSPVDTPAMPSTIGAVSHAISLVYRECKPTLPAWVTPGPLPVAPHRKTKKRRKRKKGVGPGCRMMGDAHAGTREQLGNVLLPNLTPPGMHSQFPMLGLGSSGLFENRLIAQDTQQPLALLNGSSLPPLPHAIVPKYDWQGSDNAFPRLDLQGQFSGLGNLPLPTCTISQSMPLPSLPSPFMSYGQFVTSDLSLSSLFPKTGLNFQDQSTVQQRWPLPGSGSLQSLHIPPQSNPPDLKVIELDPPGAPERQKEKSPSLRSEESSSKTHSDTQVQVSGGVQSNIKDDASSEETVSDSKNNAG